MPLTTSPEKTDGGRGDLSVGLAGAKPIASVPVPTGGAAESARQRVRQAGVRPLGARHSIPQRPKQVGRSTQAAGKIDS